MSEDVYQAPEKIHAENEQQPLTSSYLPIPLEGVSDSTKNGLITNREIEQARSPITSEPNSKHSEKSWAPLTASGRYHTTADSSLVLLESDSDNEMFSTITHATSKHQADQQLAMQLAKDGYELDRVPDNENIDLIPPASRSSGFQACTCCRIADAFCVVS